MIEMAHPPSAKPEKNEAIGQQLKIEMGANVLQKIKRILAGALLALIGLAPVIGHATDVVTHFHNDPGGTPLVATDQNGNVVWKASYQPYGQEIDQAAAGANNEIWFHGKPYEPASGLSNFGARQFDSRLGRFTGFDPNGFDADNIHSFNRYTYANNNPYRYVDLDGRQAVGIFLRLIGPALIANEVATSDVPIIGGGAAKAGLTAAERLAANQAAGKLGEAATRASLGAEIAGEQITIVTSTGQRTVADFVTKSGGIVETKTGGATLSAGQKQLRQDIENGARVTPVGKNAEIAGLKPGQSTKFETHTIDRPRSVGMAGED